MPSGTGTPALIGSVSFLPFLLNSAPARAWSCPHEPRVSQVESLDTRLARRRSCCMKIAFYGSSLLSSYWNGAATYYRGMLADLSRRGYHITFYEPDAFDRQKHRDIDPPGWADVKVYPATVEAARAVVAEAAKADVVVKASGVGVFDRELL